MNSWRLDGFTEVGELGSGAQGRVVLARRDGTGAFVAIKYVTGGGSRLPTRDEARLMASVDDDHVARLYQLVERPDGVAMVMEAVEGVSLKRLLHSHGALEPEAALLVLKGSLLGLAAAHQVGVVHRDYKPANVVVRADGTSKLIDFGLATPAGRGSLTGTPAYMAPEQWSGEPATAATDVYSATCVFYECVTGAPPYSGDNEMVLMVQHTTTPVPVEGIPERLRDLVGHGMAKRAGMRPASAAEFLRELEAAAIAEYGEDWERRGLLILAGAAAALAALFPSAVATGTAGSALGSSALGQSTVRTVMRGGRHAAGNLSRMQVLVGAAAVVAVIVVAAVAIVLAGSGDEAEPIALTKPRAPATSPAVQPPGSAPPSGSPSDSASPEATGATPAGEASTPPAPPEDEPAAAGGGAPAPAPAPPPVAIPTTPTPTVTTPAPTPVVTTPVPTPPPACTPVTQPAQAFGNVDLGSTKTMSVPVGWNDCYNADAFRVEGASADNFTIASDTCPPAEGTNCAIEVVYRPTGAAGDSATLIIPNQAGEPVVSVPLSGTGVPVPEDCSPYTETADVGEVAVGETKRQEFTYPWLICDNEGAVRVDGGDGQFTVTLTSCPPATGNEGPCGFLVTFTPKTPGTHTATMVIPSDTGGRAVDITLVGVGTGGVTESPTPDPTQTATTVPAEPESGDTTKPSTPDGQAPAHQPEAPKPQDPPATVKPEPDDPSSVPPQQQDAETAQPKASPTVN